MPHRHLFVLTIIAAAACGPLDRSAGGDPDPSSSPDVSRVTPPSLPVPVANNAVAAVETAEGTVLLSFLGLDSTKAWNGLTRDAFRWDVGDPSWRRIEPVPGPARLAATAESVGGRVYVFGGYTVAADGAERSVPGVAVYDPSADEWSMSAPIPIPVDDAVSGVWRDSLIYLVSGWHDTDNEAAVQIYDPATDSWQQGTPIPGPPVFGHAGGISGDSFVYVDGVRVDRDPRAFSLESSSWLGAIDPANPARIDWTRLEDHPGPGLYRAGAIGYGDRVVFMGGSDNPYNYNGLGYDGVPSEPAGTAFAWNVSDGAWVELHASAVPTMDHRGLVRVGQVLYAVGGMTGGQRVTASVTPLP
ncbi:MAG: galactose oxidase [Gemmatimonadota bacterium]|nr:galactose oxidase [Gemmatimonadota bacterium]